MTDLDTARQELLTAKLDKFTDWRAPELVPTIGPSDPKAFEHFLEATHLVIEKCRRQLLSYSNDQIHELKSSAPENVTPLSDEWDAFASAEIRRLERTEPPWMAGGFGHPDYQADFVYWARMPKYSLGEITCLSVGIEPTLYSTDRLESLTTRNTENLYPAIQFLVQRYKQLARQFGQRKSVSAKEFAYWAMRVEFEMQDEFLNLLRKYHTDPYSEALEKTGPKPESKREVDKIAQLLVTLAIDGYGYDPSAKRSPIPKELADKAAENGLEIHTDTIRKYLRIGAGFLASG